MSHLSDVKVCIKLWYPLEKEPTSPTQIPCLANRQPEAPIVGLGSVGRLKLRRGS